MRSSEVVEEFLKASSYAVLLEVKNITSLKVQDIIVDHLPKVFTANRESLELLLHDNIFFEKIQRVLQMEEDLLVRAEQLTQRDQSKMRQNQQDSIEAISKKTRAALARRHEKNQEEMRKDQIFVRLTPKSQNCIQFMLCNRNFPRMEVKLSCNQHLEYLINYLTNKWIRGKVGVKVALYPDSTFLKSVTPIEKQKALKEPLNNYLMFTDVMTCCGVQQNGVLNMTYEIIESKKGNSTKLAESVKESKSSHQNQGDSLKPLSMGSFGKNQQGGNAQEKRQEDSYPIRINSPVKYSYGKDELMPDASIFNKNSNFFGINEESMFGSLGFNFNFGLTHNANRKDQPLFSLNSNPYPDSYFPKSKEILPNLKEEELQSLAHLSQKSHDHGLKFEEREAQINQRKENSREKQNAASNKVDTHQKLDNLMSLLDQIEKEKDGPDSSVPQLGPLPAAEEGNNSNRFKEVKTVSIVKKKNNNT